MVLHNDDAIDFSLNDITMIVNCASTIEKQLQGQGRYWIMILFFLSSPIPLPMKKKEGEKKRYPFKIAGPVNSRLKEYKQTRETCCDLRLSTFISSTRCSLLLYPALSSRPLLSFFIPSCAPLSASSSSPSPTISFAFSFFYPIQKWYVGRWIPKRKVIFT